MKKMHLKKSFLKMVSTGMIAGLTVSLFLTGCGGSGQTSSQASSSIAALTDVETSAGSSGSTDTNGLPIVKEPFTIKIATYDNFETSASYSQGKLPIFKELEKRTGITMDIEGISSSDYTNVMQTRLAAGSNLPDLILVPGTDYLKFGSTGLILPLNDLIEKDAPNIKKLYQTTPEYQTPLICSDGKQYTIATFSKSAPFNMPSLIIRKDWLDKVGLQMPKTIEDWTKVFTAFKQTDLNGNGKQDEIPFCGIDSPFYSTDFFLSSYGLDIKDDISWDYLGWTEKDGKISSDWYNSDGVKGWLTQMNSWYKAGFFDKEMLTIDGDKWNAKILSNQVGVVGAYSLNAPQWNDKMNKDYPGVEWRNVAPPDGPGGQGFYRIGTGFLDSITYGITKNCKDPDTVMKWLDYVYGSEEGRTLLSWGIEGEDYTAADGKKTFTDSILKDANGSGYAMWVRGIIPNLPYISGTEQLESRFAQYTDTVKDMAEIGKQTKTALQFAQPTADESSKIANVRPNIRTYVTEMIPKFIIGKESVSKYDDFTAKLTKMGMNDLQTIKQAQYDRANKK